MTPARKDFWRWLLLNKRPPEPPRHEWIDCGRLDEPEIAKVEGGIWWRRAIVCNNCGEYQKVYHGMDLTSSLMTYGCPGNSDWCDCPADCVGHRHRVA